MAGRLIRIALCVFLVAWPVAGGADNRANPQSTKVTSPECVRLSQRVGREELINGCGSCRLVSVERSRPGGGFPTVRTVTVPEKARQTLPFRGPGHTRITAEQSCPGSDDEWEGDAAARSPGCVQFGQTHAGDAVLVNPCAVCRAVAVESIDLVGNLSRRSYAVAPRSSIDLPTDGLARARIIRDDPCG